MSFRGIVRIFGTYLMNLNKRMAEGVGFEPTDGGYPSLVFKTSAFNRSATLPKGD